MASDPAFLFYPGDYLRDTQCLSEAAQVAYDRIMCEHMRNICITQRQLNFFTKRLTIDEKNDILEILIKVDNGFQIKWVAESIEKRRFYSDSRRKNRLKSKKTYDKDIKNICLHMENEIENEIENINDSSFEKGLGKTFEKFTLEKCIIEFSLWNQTETSAIDFFDHYNSQGWIKANGQAITDLKSLVAKWVRNPPKQVLDKGGKHSKSVMAGAEALRIVKDKKND